MGMIWINRTKMNEEYWQKLDQVAKAKDMTREELLNQIIGTYLKHVKIKVEISE